MTIVLNGEPRDTPASTTLAALLRELELPAQRVAVEVNQELVPRAKHESFELHDGDSLEVVTLVGGG